MNFFIEPDSNKIKGIKLDYPELMG